MAGCEPSTSSGWCRPARLDELHLLIDAAGASWRVGRLIGTISGMRRIAGRCACGGRPRRLSRDRADRADRARATGPIDAGRVLGFARPRRGRSSAQLWLGGDSAPLRGVVVVDGRGVVDYAGPFGPYPMPAEPAGARRCERVDRPGNRRRARPPRLRRRRRLPAPGARRCARPRRAARRRRCAGAPALGCRTGARPRRRGRRADPDRSRRLSEPARGAATATPPSSTRPRPRASSCVGSRPTESDVIKVALEPGDGGWPVLDADGHRVDRRGGPRRRARGRRPCAASRVGAAGRRGRRGRTRPHADRAAVRGPRRRWPRPAEWASCRPCRPSSRPGSAGRRRPTRLPCTEPASSCATAPISATPAPAPASTRASSIDWPTPASAVWVHCGRRRSPVGDGAGDALAHWPDPGRPARPRSSCWPAIRPPSRACGARRRPSSPTVGCLHS